MYLKSKEEIEIMRQANKIVACILKDLEKIIEPGVRTRDLDLFVAEKIRKQNAKPAFLNYRGYPKTICASINEEVVHGIPGDRKLKQGDIIGIDIGVVYEKFYGDAARTYPVGQIGKKAAELLKVTEESLYKGIDQAKPGNRLFDVSGAVQSWVEKHGFSVVREFVGHGIGRNLHEEPQVPNYVPGTAINPLLEPGMVIALEPMVNEGAFRIQVQKDGWTAVTADGTLSAHFEHTIAITENGPDILSLC